MWPQSPGECTSESLEAVQGVTLRETHKFLCARKIKELHQPKVVSRDDVQACVGHTGAVDVSLVCISRPDANDFVSQNAVPTGRGVRCGTRLPAVRHPLREERKSQCGHVAPLSPPPLCTCPSSCCSLPRAPFTPKDKFPPSLVLSLFPIMLLSVGLFEEWGLLKSPG